MIAIIEEALDDMKEARRRLENASCRIRQAANLAGQEAENALCDGMTEMAEEVRSMAGSCDDIRDRVELIGNARFYERVDGELREDMVV